MNESAIRERIKRMLANGQLPRHGANQIAAAYGDGTPCDICGEATSRSIVTYELRFGSAHQARSILTHFACYELWKSERASEPESENP